jgi:hypothetical protein
VKVAGESNSPIYAAFVNTEVLQPVKLLRNQKVGTLARTWPMIPVGVENQSLLVLDSQTIRQKTTDEVIRQVNRFINDYLAANPKPGPPVEKAEKKIVVPPKEIVVSPKEAVTTAKGIVISPDGRWSPARGWGGNLYRHTKNARINKTEGHLEFIVEDANSLHVWRRYGLSVPIADYPIVVFTYRARNVAPGWYTIWMDDGAGPSGGCIVFRPGQLIVDGKKHEIRADLRKVRDEHKHKILKLYEKGTIKGMALGVRAGNKTPAVLEFIDLRFLPAGPAEIPVPKVEKFEKKIVVPPKVTVTLPKETVTAPKETITPPKGIVIPPDGPWSTASGWGSDLYRHTKNARINKTDGRLEFIIEEANSLHVWKRYGLSVSIADYPIAVFTYRARNVAPGWYTIWMDDGQGPWGGCIVFRPGHLIVDSKKHEIRADLRKVRDEHKHKILKLYEKGTIKGMALGVRAGNKTPAVLEFIDLRFLPEE